MLIKTVRIKNFRGIEEKEIAFKPGFNLIIGQNGKGKTSILEAMSIGLGGFVSGFSGIASRNISAQEVRRTYPLLGDGSTDEKLNLPVEIEIEAAVDGEEFSWKRSRSSVTASLTVTSPVAIKRKAENMSQQEDKELPIILFESTDRVRHQKGKDVASVSKNYYRSSGYDNALTGTCATTLLLGWCVKMEQVSWQKGMKISEYEAAKNAVAQFMQKMEQSDECRVFYDKQAEKLMFQSKERTCPVEDLSSGYQSLVWMVFDIAYRMALLNPNKKDKIAETAGVVLIDEIDMHLHPKWQWNIIEGLRTVFPNVQFIAATHSPILFGSAREVWIINMENDNIAYSFSQYGLDVNQTLDRYQDTEKVYPKVQKQVDYFYQLIDEEDYAKAEQILNELEGDVGAETPILTQLKTTLALEKMELGE